MSGETEADPSGWTPDQLAQHYNRLLDAMDRRYEQRFVAQEKAVVDAFVAQEKAVQAALAAAEKAVDKALASNDRRLEGMNEFRSSLSDLQSNLITRREAVALIDAVGQKVDTLKEQAANEAGRGHGAERARATLIAVAGVVIAALALTATVVLSAR